MEAGTSSEQRQEGPPALRAPSGGQGWAEVARTLKPRSRRSGFTDAQTWPQLIQLHGLLIGTTALACQPCPGPRCIVCEFWWPLCLSGLFREVVVNTVPSCLPGSGPSRLASPLEPSPDSWPSTRVLPASASRVAGHTPGSRGHRVWLAWPLPAAGQVVPIGPPLASQSVSTNLRFVCLPCPSSRLPGEGPSVC